MGFQGIISRQDWGALDPTGYAGEQYIDEGMILHWEGPFLGWPWDHSRCFDLVRGIQRYHMSHGYSDIAYNDVHCPHGWVFTARWGVPMRNAASGDSHVNAHTSAHCLLWGLGDDADVNVPGDQITEDTWDSVLAVRRYWVQEHGMGLWVRPHSDIVATFCPGDDARARIPSVSGLLPGEALVVVPDTGNIVVVPPPSPSFPGWPGRFLVFPPYTIGDDVAVWQARMAERGWRIGVDGWYGQQSKHVCMQFQAEKGLVADGIVGPITWDAAWTAPVD